MDQNGFRASELGSDEIGRYLCVPNSPIVLEGFEDNVDMLLCSELSYFLSQIFYDFANLEVYRFVIRYFDIQSFLERDLLCEKYSVDVSNIFPGNILSDTITETFGLINPINEKHRKKLLTVVADFSLPKDIDKINDVVYSLTCDFLDNEPLVGNVNFEIKTFLGGSNATKKYPCWGIQGAGVFVFREFTDDDACTIEEKISTKIHGLLSDIIEFINIMVGISYSIPDGLKGILLDWEENTDTIDITFCIKVFARLHNNSTLPGKEKEKIYKITQMLLYLRLFYDSKDNGDGDGDYVNGSMPETLSVVRFSVIGSLVTGIGKYAGDMLATREVVISNLSGLSLKDRVFVSYSHSKVRSRIYAIEDVEKSKILEKIALSKSNLFIAQDCIQKEKLFNYIMEVNDMAQLEEIYVFLNSNDYSKGYSENELIAILRYTLWNTEYIHDMTLIQDAIKYINMGVSVDAVFNLPVVTMQNLRRLKNPDTTMISNFISLVSGDVERGEDILKNETLIKKLELDLLYLHEGNTGYAELHELRAGGYIDKDYDFLKGRMDHLYQTYSLDDKIRKNRRYIGGKDPRIFIPILGHILDIVGTHFSGGSGKTEREGIITYIFQQDEGAILFLSDVLERVHFVKGDTLTTVVECLGLCVRKRLFISEIIRGRDTYTLSELKEQLSGEEIYYSRKVGEVFGDYYVIGTDKQRISLILKIGELLDDSDREDFILYVTADTSLQFLMNIYRVIVILKRFNAAYGVISELLTMNLDEGSISTLYKRLKGRNANNVNGTDMKGMILGYLGNGDVGNFASLDTIMMVNTNLKISGDIMLAEAIERNDMEELNTIADDIDSMIGKILELFHPSKVSSTRNNNFGKGSGSFTKRVNSYVFSVLLRKTDEGAIEYLHRIKQINWSELLEIDLSDIHDSAFSLIKIILLKHKDTYGLFYALTHFWQIIESFATSSGNGSRSQSVNLGGLPGYYHNVLEGAMEKVSLLKDNH